MKKVNLIMSFIMLAFIMTSCNDDNTNATYPVAIKMTDAPGPYEKVLIDLQEVRITGSTGQEVSLNVNKGIYDLLKLTNGATALIATDVLADAKVEQIRLVLGSNNTVVVNGVSYPLETPSAEQSGLKLQVHQTLTAGVLYEILLDFDANKSIVLNGNGTYKLKPVIRTIQTAIGGSIRGSITPVGLASVTAVDNNNATLTYSTYVDATGGFLLAGLPAGSYTVTVTPASPKLAVTNTNVVVTNGVTTTVGVFTILP